MIAKSRIKINLLIRQTVLRLKSITPAAALLDNCPTCQHTPIKGVLMLANVYYSTSLLLSASPPIPFTPTLLPCSMGQLSFKS
jgi:hypothetical protein